jgi:hypothetical protein
MFTKITLVMAGAALLAACSGSLPNTGGNAVCRPTDMRVTALSAGAYDVTAQITMPTPVRTENWRMEASAAPTH